MLDDNRLRELADDIAVHGLREPIKLYQGAIIDGRNRHAACGLVGVQPKFVSVDDDIDPWAYVWSLNGERRDLTAERRYLIWKRVNEQSDEWRAVQKRIQDDANEARAEAAKAGRVGRASSQGSGFSLTTDSGSTKPNSYAGSKAKAAASNTNRGAVERMDRLDRERPDLAEKVIAGEIKPAEAVREMARAEIAQKLQSVAEREVHQPTGLFDVIVIDPPWPMEKIERDERPNQVRFDYPIMTEAELAALTLPADDDCHVWLWTTHKFLPMAFRLLDAWQLKYVCSFVWYKPGGFQPVGLPQYNCEFALYARKGSPKFLSTKDLPVCFTAARGAHSEKPEEFYSMVRRVTGGRRIDMFNRRPIQGFVGWGKEAAS
jgi:N6-adenosine-specific RNA methylase IME4